MRLFKLTILVGAILCIGAVGAATANAAPVIFHPVMLDGKHVQVRQVGAISARPCASNGCVKGIVSLRWGGTEVALHHVRCGFPRSLHVVRARWGTYHAFAFIHACHRTYRWMLA